jgi:hypothetical protein
MLMFWISYIGKRTKIFLHCPFIRAFMALNKNQQLKISSIFLSKNYTLWYFLSAKKFHSTYFSLLKTPYDSPKNIALTLPFMPQNNSIICNRHFKLPKNLQYFFPNIKQKLRFLVQIILICSGISFPGVTCLNPHSSLNNLIKKRNCQFKLIFIECVA